MWNDRYWLSSRCLLVDQTSILQLVKSILLQRRNNIEKKEDLCRVKNEVDFWRIGHLAPSTIYPPRIYDAQVPLIGRFEKEVDFWWIRHLALSTIHPPHF